MPNLCSYWPYLDYRFVFLRKYLLLKTLSLLHFSKFFNEIFRINFKLNFALKLII